MKNHFYYAKMIYISLLIIIVFAGLFLIYKSVETYTFLERSKKILYATLSTLPKFTDEKQIALVEHLEPGSIDECESSSLYMIYGSKLTFIQVVKTYTDLLLWNKWQDDSQKYINPHFKKNGNLLLSFREITSPNDYLLKTNLSYIQQQSVLAEFSKFLTVYELQLDYTTCDLQNIGSNLKVRQLANQGLTLIEQIKKIKKQAFVIISFDYSNNRRNVGI